MKDFIPTMLFFLNNMKIYHWRTTTFSRHKASDDAFAHIQDLFDKFVETYSGRYGRDKLFPPGMNNQSTSIVYFNDKNINTLVKQLVKFLTNASFEDPELINIRDDMLTVLNQTLYLFTLS